MNKQTIFINKSHPQTVLYASILSYMTGVFGLLEYLGYSSSVGIIGGAASVSLLYSGYMIANGKKISIPIAIGASVIIILLPLIVTILGGHSISSAISIMLNINYLISVIFNIALLVLLTHKETKSYTKIWFS